MMAGFDKAIFIIKKENEAAFRDLLSERAGKYMDIQYVFQELTDLPEGYSVPSGREKPWGTAHAVLSARKAVDGPMAVINADDYYGPGAFQSIYGFLENAADDGKYHYCMVGYRIENTLTENGYVSRGVCETSQDGNLSSITERTKIRWSDGLDGIESGKIVYTEDDGATWNELAKGTIVSMNFWGFTPSMMKEMENGFPAFLDKAMAENPLKGEYFLPGVVDRLISENKADVRVLSSMDRWYGVTYKEDLDAVKAALQSMKDKGEYPDVLWK